MKNERKCKKMRTMTIDYVDDNLFLFWKDVNWKQCQLCFCCEKDLGKRWQLKINGNWFLYEFRLEKDVKRISIDNSILCKTITIGNERTSPLSGRKNKAANDCQRLWDVVGVRHVHVVRGEERLWMDDCWMWLWSATDKQHHQHHHLTSTTRTTTDGPISI